MAVKVDCVSTNRSIFDLRQEFEAGLLYWYGCNGYTKIEKITSLAAALTSKNAFIKTEVSAPWTDSLNGTIKNCVLCWVDNYGYDEKNIVELIAYFNSEYAAPYHSIRGSSWQRAKPLTQDELKQFAKTHRSK
jgi:hypothetical protein